MRQPEGVARFEDSENADCNTLAISDVDCNLSISSMCNPSPVPDGTRTDTVHKSESSERALTLSPSTHDKLNTASEDIDCCSQNTYTTRQESQSPDAHPASIPVRNRSWSFGNSRTNPSKPGKTGKAKARRQTTGTCRRVGE